MDVATIVIGDPLGEQAVESALFALEAAADSDARVFVLEGCAGHFCSGMDLSAVEATAARLQRFAALLGALVRSPRPTIAAVDGAALGGGLGIAAACDFVLATDRSSFGLPEALYGLSPAIIRPVLLGRLTPQRLRLLVLSCRSRTADEAAALGLVDRVVPGGSFAAARRAAIRELGRASTDGVRACRRWDEAELARQLAEGVDETARALARPSVRASIAAISSGEELPWQS